MKRRLSGATAARSSRRSHRQQLVIAVFILAFGAVAIVTEQWLAVMFDDNLIAAMFMLIASIVVIAFVSPLVTRTA